jgi:5-(carboxyamino)imidazole ribonucleotide synthase
LTQRAEQAMTALLTSLDYVGVLTLELFVVGDQLLANEFAPRVHNSGHWSIEGAVPSQFTSHLIAISNGRLDVPRLQGYAGMMNLIGEIPAVARSLPGSHLHDYGKEARPGRKLGHITVIADSAAERDRLLAEIADKTG